MTVKEHMKAAFEALLRGDTEERDRLCRLAKEAMAAEPVERASEKFYASGLPLIQAAQAALGRKRP